MWPFKKKEVRHVEPKSETAPAPSKYVTCNECKLAVERTAAQQVLDIYTPSVYYRTTRTTVYYCPAHKKPYIRVETDFDYKTHYYQQGASFLEVDQLGRPIAEVAETRRIFLRDYGIVQS